MNNKKHGENGTEVMQDGTVMVGEYRDGVMIRGKITESSGDVYVG